MGALHIALLAVAVGSGETVLLDFTAPWCGPCQRMAPIVEGLAAQNVPIRAVDLDSNRELAAQYNVTSIPCFVLVKDGKEVDRIVGMTSGEELEAMLARHGVEAKAPQQPGMFGGALSRLTGGRFFGRGRETAAQQPASDDPDAASRAGLGEAPPFAPPQVEMAPPANPASGAPATFAQAAPPAAAPYMPQGADAPRAPVAAPPAAPAAPDMNGQAAKLLAATVRLRIEEPNGHSVGTGTIVDAREGEALVLTCGHVFRESQGKGRINIDMFAPALNNLPGRLISYDLESDVALVAFRPGGPVTVARIAPATQQVREGDSVLTIGCDHGQPPTVIASRVLSINRFQGQPNLQVAGQPVQGRSGGGLFAADGHVIGVCNAADPTDNQGLFAALAAIHAELNEMQLGDIYQAGPEAGAQANAAQFNPQGGAPAMANDMPAATPPAGAAPPIALATMGPNDPPSADELAGLSSEERAALAEIQARSGEAEIVCVIRPLADPGAKSEIIVLNQASPEFVRQLALESRRAQDRRLTSMQMPRPAAGGLQPMAPDSIDWQPSQGTPATP